MHFLTSNHFLLFVAFNFTISPKFAKKLNSGSAEEESGMQMLILHRKLSLRGHFKLFLMQFPFR